jgi:hypothetical protein
MGMGGVRMRMRVWRIGAVEVVAKRIIKGLADCLWLDDGGENGLLSLGRLTE